VRVSILCVGKIRKGPLRTVIDDYYGRIRHYAKLDEVEIADAGEDELRKRFEKGTDARARKIALEVDGRAMSSRALAEIIGDCELHSVPAITFMIGGAYGLPRGLASDVRLSLSAMTLPHKLARLVLAEQVYRGFTILRGEPYSHD
jgi:23S rRNA (pseudouridine1915-N3)-methyltransferase